MNMLKLSVHRCALMAGLLISFWGQGTSHAETAVVATTAAPAAVVAAPVTASGMPAAPAGMPATPDAAAAMAAAMAPDSSPAPEGAQESNPAAEVEFGKDNNNAPGNEFQRYVAKAVGTSLPLFGSHLFVGGPSTYAPVNNVPVTPDYVLGPGDELLIRVWGAVDMNARVVIDRDGQISIPQVGTIGMAGIKAGDAEGYLRTKIGRVFRNFELNVTLGQLRSISIYVVGHARRPGTYTLSSLSTLINALFASGGPSSTGSMRHVQLKRSGQVVTELDLYDFIVKGDNSMDARLLPGDVIVIPPAGPRVAVAGAFNAPAIYELKDRQSSIGDVLGLSGGLTVVTTDQMASLERIDPSQATPRKVVQLALDPAGLQTSMRDGDILTLFPISPKFDNAITLKGHVASPMRYSWHEGMRVSDLLKDNRALIPVGYWEALNRGQTMGNYSRNEVNWDYATIQRLDQDKLTTKLFAFDLGKAIRGDKAADVVLEPGDIVTVFGWNDPLPETENSVLFTGDAIGGAKRFVWHEGMRIQDVIPDTQWLIDYYGYWQNMRGEGKKLEMNWDYANVVRLSKDDLSKDTLPFNLGEAISRPGSVHNLKLQAGDVINLFTNEQIAVPVAKRKMYVSIEGEVATPGIYQVNAGETLRQLVMRVGGVSPQSYVYGAEFYRNSTRAAQQKKLDEVLDRMERSLAQSGSEQTASALSEEELAAKKASAAFQRQVLANMREVKAKGRIVLEVPSDNNGAVHLPDLPLEDGDRLFIPSRPAVVQVLGEVHNENAYLYKPGKKLGDYLDLAGGPTENANEDGLYVIKADGSVNAPNGGGWFSSWFHSQDIHPGDTIVVPLMTKEKFSWTKELKDWTQILYQFGLGVASLKVLKDL